MGSVYMIRTALASFPFSAYDTDLLTDQQYLIAVHIKKHTIVFIGDYHQNEKSHFIYITNNFNVVTIKNSYWLEITRGLVYNHLWYLCNNI